MWQAHGEFRRDAECRGMRKCARAGGAEAAMLGKLIHWRAMRRKRRMVAVDSLIHDTDGVAKEIGLARHGSGDDALCDLAEQQ